MAIKTHAQRSLLATPDTYALVLLGICYKHYGSKALSEWLPQTFILELEEDFNVKLPRLCQQKLVVGLTVMRNNDCFSRVQMFMDMCNVFSGSEFGNSFDKADAFECNWGMIESTLIMPPEKDEHRFSDKVLRYVGEVCVDEGIWPLPQMLRLAKSDRLMQASTLAGIDTGDEYDFESAFLDRQQKSKEIEESSLKMLQELTEQFSVACEIPQEDLQLTFENAS